MKRENWVPDWENDPIFYTMRRTSERGAKFLGDVVHKVRLYRPLVVGDPIQGEIVDERENKVQSFKLSEVTDIQTTGQRQVVSAGVKLVLEFTPRPKKQRS